MVGTILPIVYGERMQTPKIRPGALVAYIAGTVIGGTALGIVISLIGLGLRLHKIWSGSTTAILLVGLSAHAFLAIRETGLVNVPLPQSHWQVRRTWVRDLHPKVAALLYGLILGFGIFTRIPTGVFYALLIWIAFRGDARFGALALSLVGLGRALPLMLLARATTNGEQMLRWSNVLHRWFPVVRFINALVLASAAGWIVAAVFEG
jgi:sulfite exporter TauE/SafE